MKQLSNYVYSDGIFDSIDIPDAIFASPYKDYPYFIIKNFFSSEACKDLSTLVQHDSQSKQKAEVRQEDSSTLVESYRKTNMGQLTDYYERYYTKQFDTYRAEIEAYFSVVLSTSTKVQVLEYTKGYFYMKHADDSSELVNKSKKTVGFKVIAPQRKLTSVLFMSSHEKHEKSNKESFTGGELLFNYLYDAEGKMMKIEAEAGDMIVFPSHPYFSHEVLPVTKGYRLTLVQWHDTIS